MDAVLNAPFKKASKVDKTSYAFSDFWHIEGQSEVGGVEKEDEDDSRDLS